MAWFVRLINVCCEFAIWFFWQIHVVADHANSGVVLRGWTENSRF